MLSSKELINKTVISRATLNNYINLGILPRPVVLNPDAGANGPRQLGYFPEWVIDRIAQVRDLKSKGWTMDKVVDFIKSGQSKLEPASHPLAGGDDGVRATALGPLNLSVDELKHPAYMVNYSFELTWFNDPARRSVLGDFEVLPAQIEARNIFHFLVKVEQNASTDALLRFHLRLAKARLSSTHLAALQGKLSAGQSRLLEDLFGESDPIAGGPIVESSVEAELPGYSGRFWRIYCSFYREGILVVYTPDESPSETFLSFLSCRDVVIRDLLRRRLPVLTNFAVLVADLQQSVKICTELPPEEYFELINEIWSTLEPVLRGYYGTFGKHCGDGMLYYFFPQPDCSYLFNALRCAAEIKSAMARISKAWQLRKGWFNELHLNVGLNEGQEWLGTLQTANSIEFTVLGDTINHAARLSDFARGGSIWVTKNMLSKLAPEERRKVKFGIRRQDEDGRERFIASTYSSVSSLLRLELGRNEKLQDVATLAVTEVVEVSTENT